MKTLTLLISLFLSLLLTNEACAQTIDMSKFPDLEPYTGTWVGSLGKDSLVVTIKKRNEYFEPLDINADRLVGTFKYFKNGKLKIDNFDSDENTLTIGNLNKDEDGNPEFLSFNFKDLKKDKGGRVIMSFQGETQQVVTWKLRVRQGIYVGKQPKGFTKFSVPTKIILRKIK